jgi:hypothetical protein
LGTVLGINLGTGCTGFSAGFTGFGGDAEAVEALVCKTGLSGFESRRYLHSLKGLCEDKSHLDVTYTSRLGDHLAQCAELIRASFTASALRGES